MLFFRKPQLASAIINHQTRANDDVMQNTSNAVNQSVFKAEDGRHQETTWADTNDSVG